MREGRLRVAGANQVSSRSVAEGTDHLGYMRVSCGLLVARPGWWAYATQPGMKTKSRDEIDAV